METKLIHTDQEWPYILTLLPEDLDELARETQALVRCRNIPDAASLMRMALAYAISDLSLKDVAAWASALGVADITGPGLFYRIREAESWLQIILALILGHDVGKGPKGLRLRIVDATVINGPGAKGTEWRAHVIVDPETGCFQSVELSDSHGGESYTRYVIEEGDVVLGDRAYATARGIHAVRLVNAHVVVRLNPHTIRICGLDRHRISLLDKEEDVPKVGGVEYDVLLPIPPERRNRSHKTWKLEDAVDWIPARVVAARTRNSNVIWVLTTLSKADLPSNSVLSLYRLRWQVELTFKRLKSLLHLDNLPSRQGPTAKSWMLAKFIAAALAQKLVQPNGPLSPWGYEILSEGVYP